MFFSLNIFTRYLLLGWICELIFSSSSVTILSRKNYKINHYSRIFPTPKPSRPNNNYYGNKVNIKLSFCLFVKKSFGEGLKKRLILKNSELFAQRSENVINCKNEWRPSWNNFYVHCNNYIKNRTLNLFNCKTWNLTQKSISLIKSATISLR